MPIDLQGKLNRLNTIKAYIKKQRTYFDDKTIRTSLRNNGYTKSEINAGFRDDTIVVPKKEKLISNQPITIDGNDNRKILNQALKIIRKNGEFMYTKKMLQGNQLFPKQKSYIFPIIVAVLAVTFFPAAIVTGIIYGIYINKERVIIKVENEKIVFSGNQENIKKIQDILAGDTEMARYI